MLDTSVLLLIIPDHQSNKSIITGKLFEYIASGKPLICLGPTDGDAAGFLNKTGPGVTFSYTDSEGISGFLSNVFSGKTGMKKSSPEIFGRRELTRKVVALLEKLN